ncbi:Trypanosomal VSG domain/Trypanosome variant surface glycoprotein C-terminal domain containing protein, putative [Trypanosoma equiperdum]|uniref:Trypanosomal VSG domain/Trypanosome variant surface glycoprotein C-terminal domain containing protein, putative n=1 Tax=Trypanosoma equiperdum TaxID=5694 RepID=A0A1G4IFT7_TRYEQ|nr:Trypanosomal VSG domain/Trypanosome variant surface glycoprotein C-terminal domain containing protein, putative [Trypanosoma equiperdum]
MQPQRPFLLVLLLVPTQTSAQVAAGDNAAVYKQLCKLIRITEATADIPEPIPEDKADYDALHLLNATLSTPEWLKQFDKKGPNNQRQTAPEGPHASDKTWQTRWPNWLAAATKLDEDATKTKVYQKLKINPPSVAEKEAKRLAIATELEAAARAAATLGEAKTELADNTKQKAQEALQTAAFGGKEKTLATVAAAELKAGGPPSDATQLCVQTGTSTTTTSLTGLMMCICTKTNSSGQGKSCTSTRVDSTTVSGNFANLQTLMTALVGNCQERDKQKLTGSEIRQALSDFKATATRSNSQTIFWTFVTTDCHGSSASGQCVLYNGNVAQTKGEMDTSKWSRELTTAAKVIGAIIKHNEKVAAAQDRIRQAKEAVITIMQLPLMPHSRTDVTTKLQTTTTVTDAEANQKKCDQHHNNQTECEKLKCSYDANAADGIKCKPKTGTENKTSAGAGETVKEGAPAYGCAAHKDKTTCENDKKDGKPSRAWRKEKDNEDDKDTEKCRNGSFLVNKQLGLMAAVFLEFATF